MPTELVLSIEKTHPKISEKLSALVDRTKTHGIRNPESKKVRGNKY